MADTLKQLIKTVRQFTANTGDKEYWSVQQEFTHSYGKEKLLFRPYGRSFGFTNWHPTIKNLMDEINSLPTKRAPSVHGSTFDIDLPF